MNLCSEENVGVTALLLWRYPRKKNRKLSNEEKKAKQNLGYVFKKNTKVLPYTYIWKKNRSD
jgi:hypothetical protein